MHHSIMDWIELYPRIAVGYQHEDEGGGHDDAYPLAAGAHFLVEYDPNFVHIDTKQLVLFCYLRLLYPATVRLAE